MVVRTLGISAATLLSRMAPPFLWPADGILKKTISSPLEAGDGGGLGEAVQGNPKPEALKAVLIDYNSMVYTCSPDSPDQTASRRFVDRDHRHETCGIAVRGFL